ncbi:MAG: YkgJ family cysteine cluster protein [Nitrosomonadales bacterium]|nr:MAG: YkgJ family cysteine cluster protein [Nitrosomonadales bacterium]
MKIPIVAEYTPEQRRELASEKLDGFFSSVPAELRARVTSLPKRISQMNARTSVKLQEVLRTADLIFAHAGKYAACARGCGHCCHVSVPIADFEAQYMEDHIGAAATPLKQSIRHELKEFSAQTPCPFLENGECSIYEYRPLTCRMHLNFDIDSYWCRHENWNKPEAIIPRPDIRPLMDAYHLLGGKTRPIVADIRDFFPHGKTS